MPAAQCDQGGGIFGSATLYRVESRDRAPAPERLAPGVARAHLLLLEQLLDERRQHVEHAARLRKLALLPRVPPVPLGAPARLPLLLEIDDGHRSALPTPGPVQFPDYNQGLTFRRPASLPRAIRRPQSRSVHFRAALTPGPRIGWRRRRVRWAFRAPSVRRSRAGRCTCTCRYT